MILTLLMVIEYTVHILGQFLIKIPFSLLLFMNGHKIYSLSIQQARIKLEDRSQKKKDNVFA